MDAALSRRSLVAVAAGGAALAGAAALYLWSRQGGERARRPRRGRHGGTSAPAAGRNAGPSGQEGEAVGLQSRACRAAAVWAGSAGA